MQATTSPNRQKDLEHIIVEALKNPKLLDALKAFQMSQSEYNRAINNSMNIKIISASTTNPGERPNASLDKH